MSMVQRCTEQDVPDIANLHNKVLNKTAEPASEGLQNYYRDTFFHNPWYNEEISSLVYRNGENRIVGFLGVVPRQMILNGSVIRVAVGHRLMVDPDANSPMAAIQLIRVFFSGPQDLAISDGANDIGKKFWEGSGGTAAHIYSMNWLKPLQPLSYAINILKKKTSPGFRINEAVMLWYRLCVFACPAELF